MKACLEEVVDDELKGRQNPPKHTPAAQARQKSTIFTQKHKSLSRVQVPVHGAKIVQSVRDQPVTTISASLPKQTMGLSASCCSRTRAFSARTRACSGTYPGRRSSSPAASALKAAPIKKPGASHGSAGDVPSFGHVCPHTDLEQRRRHSHSQVYTMRPDALSSVPSKH